MNKSDNRVEEQLVRLGERLSGLPSVEKSVMSAIEHAEPARKPIFNHRRILIVMSKPRNLVATAAILAIVILGFRPWDTTHDNGPGTWWLTPPSAWAAELQTAIEKAGERGYSCREQYVSLKFAPPSVSSTSSTLFVAGGRYRRDIFEQGQLRESQWYVHGDDGLTMTSVRYIDKNYTVTLDPKAHQDGNPMARMNALSQLLNKSGIHLGEERIDGRDAVGFEIESKNLDARSDKSIVTIWLEQATKMPLRIETVFDNLLLKQDQFTWNATLPANTFEPAIPAGFAKVESK